MGTTSFQNSFRSFATRGSLWFEKVHPGFVCPSNYYRIPHFDNIWLLVLMPNVTLVVYRMLSF